VRQDRLLRVLPTRDSTTAAGPRPGTRFCLRNRCRCWCFVGRASLGLESTAKRIVDFLNKGLTRPLPPFRKTPKTYKGGRNAACRGELLRLAPARGAGRANGRPRPCPLPSPSSSASAFAKKPYKKPAFFNRNAQFAAVVPLNPKVRLPWGLAPAANCRHCMPGPKNPHRSEVFCERSERIAARAQTHCSHRQARRLWSQFLTRRGYRRFSRRRGLLDPPVAARMLLPVNSCEAEAFLPPCIGDVRSFKDPGCALHYFQVRSPIVSCSVFRRIANPRQPRNNQWGRDRIRKDQKAGPRARSAPDLATAIRAETWCTASNAARQRGRRPRFKKLPTFLQPTTRAAATRRKQIRSGAPAPP